MKHLIPALVLAASLSGLAVPSASAYDKDDHADAEIHHIQHDRAKINADAGRVREEAGELEQARISQWRSWLHGNHYGEIDAQTRIRTEQAELAAAHRKLKGDVADIHRDRAGLNEDIVRHHRWSYHRWWW